MELNAGDVELKPYLDPLLRNVGGNLKTLSQEQVNNGNSSSIIECVGNKMWLALNSSLWKHREAAATAFLQYLEASPTPRYQELGTAALFRASINIALLLCADKIQSVYMIGLRILDLALKPPILNQVIKKKIV